MSLRSGLMQLSRMLNMANLAIISSSAMEFASLIDEKGVEILVRKVLKDEIKHREQRVLHSMSVDEQRWTDRLPVVKQYQDTYGYDQMSILSLDSKNSEITSDAPPSLMDFVLEKVGAEEALRLYVTEFSVTVGDSTAGVWPLLRLGCRATRDIPRQHFSDVYIGSVSALLQTGLDFYVTNLIGTDECNQSSDYTGIMNSLSTWLAELKAEAKRNSASP